MDKGNLETAELLDSIKFKAIESYLTLEKKLLPLCMDFPNDKQLFTEAMLRPEIAALSIATRPDCLEPEKILLLRELNLIKPVWVELGLQTIHPKTAQFIRRGYPLSCFEETVKQLKAAGLTVVVHLILGLPGETQDQMLQSVDYLAHFCADKKRVLNTFTRRFRERGTRQGIRFNPDL